MIEKLQFVDLKLRQVYDDIRLASMENIDFKKLEKIIEDFKNKLFMINQYIYQNDINSNNIRDEIAFRLYNSIEERRKIIDAFMRQLELIEHIMIMTNNAYDLYLKEQNEERKKYLLSSYYLQYEKEYRLYQGIKIIKLNITDKDFKEKLQYLLQDVRRLKIDEPKESKKREIKKSPEENKGNLPKLDIEQQLKTKFSALYGRNRLYFRRPYDRSNCISALNEMNDFFLEHHDIIDYIKEIDVNSIDQSERMLLEQMQKIIKDIEDYPDVLTNHNKTY